MNTTTLKALGLGAALLAATAGSAFAATSTAYVNVRSGPGPSYRVVDTLRPGEWVSVNGVSGSWCHVQKSGPDGWVACRYVSGNRWDRGPNITFRFGTQVNPPRHNNWPRNDYPHHNGNWDYPNHNGNWDWQDAPSPGVSFGFGFSQ